MLLVKYYQSEIFLIYSVFLLMIIILKEMRKSDLRFLNEKCGGLTLMAFWSVIIKISLELFY